jgi:acyl-CoA thioesterase-2
VQIPQPGGAVLQRLRRGAVLRPDGSEVVPRALGTILEPGGVLLLHDGEVPRQQLWFRLNGNPGDDPVLHRTLLAYVSDFYLIGTATLPHGISYLGGNLIMASLDHAMWFHRDVRLDNWLLYDCDSPSACGSRGLARGLIYDQQGRLVASTAQEGMIRVVGEDADLSV